MVRTYIGIAEITFQDLPGDLSDEEVWEAINERLNESSDGFLLSVDEADAHGSRLRRVKRPLSEGKAFFEPVTDLKFTRKSECYAGVRATNRDALMEAVDCYYVAPTSRTGWGPITLLEDLPALKVALPCGNVREWHLKAWLPYSSVECHCDGMAGRHFFVRYTDEEEKKPRWWGKRWAAMCADRFLWLVFAAVGIGLGTLIILVEVLK